jgi:hypothetical protein
VRVFALICLLGLTGNFARAHDPYEITSAVYVRSNVIELFIEMEFPAGMKLAGIEPVRDVAVVAQFEKAQPQLTALAGSFFTFTAGNNKVAALTTNVALGVEDHIQLKVEFAATLLRPLQFTARGLQNVVESPYGTSLTVLDMVNQKVLGQTTLFADSPRAEFPPPPPEASAPTAPAMAANPSPEPNSTNISLAPPAVAPRTPAAPTPSAAPVTSPRQPSWLLFLVLAGALVLITFAFFRRRD